MSREKAFGEVVWTDESGGSEALTTNKPDGHPQGHPDVSRPDAERGERDEGAPARSPHRPFPCPLPLFLPYLTHSPHPTHRQTPILSLAATQSSLLSHEVYLTDRIDKSVYRPSPTESSLTLPPPVLSSKRDRMPHLKCIMFISSDPDTLEWAKEELAEPKYGSYWLCKLSLSSAALSSGIRLISNPS